jgi:hypothetical protein
VRSSPRDPQRLANAKGQQQLDPWNRGTAISRIQYVIDSSHFTNQGVTYPIIISKLRYRADSAAATINWPAARGPTSASTWRAARSTTPRRARRSRATSPRPHDRAQRPVTVSPGTGNGAGFPGQWYITIPLTTPFPYDPSLGNDLTVDIYEDGTGWTARARTSIRWRTSARAGARQPHLQHPAERAHRATGTFNANTGAVTEFSYVPASGLYAIFDANVTGARRRSPSASEQLAHERRGRHPQLRVGLRRRLGDRLDRGEPVVRLHELRHLHRVAHGDRRVAHAEHDDAHGLHHTDIVTPRFTTSFVAPGYMQFTDTSTPTPTSWAWDFDGDSIIDSTQQNPVAQLPMCSTRRCR